MSDDILVAPDQLSGLPDAPGRTRLLVRMDWDLGDDMQWQVGIVNSCFLDGVVAVNAVNVFRGGGPVMNVPVSGYYRSPVFRSPGTAVVPGYVGDEAELVVEAWEVDGAYSRTHKRIALNDDWHQTLILAEAPHSHGAGEDPEADGVLTDTPLEYRPHADEPEPEYVPCGNCGDNCYAMTRSCFCCNRCYSYSDDAP